MPSAWNTSSNLAVDLCVKVPNQELREARVVGQDEGRVASLLGDPLRHRWATHSGTGRAVIAQVNTPGVELETDSGQRVLLDRQAERTRARSCRWRTRTLVTERHVSISLSDSVRPRDTTRPKIRQRPSERNERNERSSPDDAPESAADF
jgi:hypothetical protein